LSPATCKNFFFCNFSIYDICTWYNNKHENVIETKNHGDDPGTAIYIPNMTTFAVTASTIQEMQLTCILTVRLRRRIFTISSDKAFRRVSVSCALKSQV
jgi:hypothetical protein